MNRFPQITQVGDREYTPAEWAEAMRAERYLDERSHMQYLWELVSKPLKFPAPSRRRRGDREWPKAA